MLLRAFEDTIVGSQEHLFRPHLTTVYDIMQISLWGERDPDITYDFVPLREETPKENAEIRKMDAETDQIRIDSGVVSQEEARTKLAADEESGGRGERRCCCRRHALPGASRAQSPGNGGAGQGEEKGTIIPNFGIRGYHDD